MTCPHCGASVPDNETTCAYCGNYVSPDPVPGGGHSQEDENRFRSEFSPRSETRQGPTPLYKRWQFWFFILLVLFYGVLFVLNHMPKSSDSLASPLTAAPVAVVSVSPTMATSPTPAATSTPVPTPTPTPVPTPEPTPTPVPTENIWLSAGMYKVGTDIPAGIYYVKCTGTYCYLEVSTDSTGAFSSIVTNENIKTSYYVSVSDGEYFSVNNGEFCPEDEAPLPVPDGSAYAPGMYLIGRDIPAGEYTLEAEPDGIAYFEIRSDCKGDYDEVIGCNCFQGSHYLTVSDDEYLYIKDCVIDVNS